MSKQECDSVFLFVAEMTGSFVPGSGTVEDKIKCGQHDYVTNHLPDLDLSKEEDRKDLSELIWLERLYEDLDGYFSLPGGDGMGRFLAIDTEAYRASGEYRWSTPVECDSSASLLQITSVLLGDRRLMEMTNVIGDTLEDPWKLEGLPRKMLKEAMVPALYGSSQACHELWQNAGMKYTAKDIKVYSEALANGPYGLANLFKEFVINNCKPKAEMEVTLWKDKFTISCNHFRNVGDVTKAYKSWDSIDEQYNVILHTDTKKVPDLDRFRKYFQTLTIHGLDSQVMNAVMTKVMAKYGWGIPIHDAAVVSPAAAHDTRKWYAEELEDIYRNRESILNNFFKSIGITGEAKEQWETLKSKIVPFEGEFSCNLMALK
jgi:hypothetical protein